MGISPHVYGNLIRLQPNETGSLMMGLATALYILQGYSPRPHGWNENVRHEPPVTTVPTTTRQIIETTLTTTTRRTTQSTSTTTTSTTTTTTSTSTTTTTAAPEPTGPGPPEVVTTVRQVSGQSTVSDATTSTASTANTASTISSSSGDNTKVIAGAVGGMVGLVLLIGIGVAIVKSTAKGSAAATSNLRNPGFRPRGAPNNNHISRVVPRSPPTHHPRDPHRVVQSDETRLNVRPIRNVESNINHHSRFNPVNQRSIQRWPPVQPRGDVRYWPNGYGFN